MLSIKPHRFLYCLAFLLLACSAAAEVELEGPLRNDPSGGAAPERLSVEVKKTIDSQVLLHDGKVIFEGSRLADSRVTRAGEYIALNAYESNDVPVEKAEWTEIKRDDGTVAANVSAIWLTNTASGVKTRLTPKNLTAVEPCISPDGKWIAFTGREVLKDGLGQPYLYIASTQTKRLTRISGTENVIDTIRVIAWQDNHTFTARSTRGETAKYKHFWRIMISDN